MRPDAIDWSNHQDHLTLAFLPRQQFHRIVRAWVIRLVIVQVLATVAVLVLLQGPWRSSSRVGSETALAEFAADELKGHTFREDDQLAYETIHRIASQPGVTFAVVADEMNQPVIVAGTDTEGWQNYLGKRRSAPSAAASTDVKALAAQVVIDVPLSSHNPDQHVHLIIGMRDRSMQRALVDGGMAIGAGLLIVGLCVVPFFFRRIGVWSRGIGYLHAAIRRLTLGAAPQPASIVHDDEVSYLAIAFNDMAMKLLGHRNELERLNTELEDRVAQRTVELKEAMAKLEEQALIDALTGLPNRRAMVNGMDRMLATSERAGTDLVVLGIDLDGFKGVNDTLGHAAGDQLLQMAADLFQSTCGKQGLASRLGGDEFVLIIPLNDCHLATPIAERLIYEFRLQSLERFVDAGLETTPSMSIGIASRQQVGSDDPEMILKAADQAMYKAKRLGKSRFHIFHEDVATESESAHARAA